MMIGNGHEILLKAALEGAMLIASGCNLGTNKPLAGNSNRVGVVSGKAGSEQDGGGGNGSESADGNPVGNENPDLDPVNRGNSNARGRNND